jgi:hypothetical protein
MGPVEKYLGRKNQFWRVVGCTECAMFRTIIIEPPGAAEALSGRACRGSTSTVQKYNGTTGHGDNGDNEPTGQAVTAVTAVTTVTTPTRRSAFYRLRLKPERLEETCADMCGSPAMSAFMQMDIEPTSPDERPVEFL